MHIRTNIELSYVQIVILAICPLLMVVNTLESALIFAILTVVCYFISAFICAIFNKYFSNSTKIFVTALVSAFVVTVLNFVIKEYSLLNLRASDNYFYAILSTVVLSTDNNYIETKALVDDYFSKLLRVAVAFVLFLTCFAVIKEFLAFGTVYNKKIFVYAGFDFFKTLVFDFILLGIICAIAEMIHRVMAKKINDKKMLYAKFKRKIRNEKKYQYDVLRRKKLLDGDIQKNIIGGEEAKKMIQQEKEAEDELIEEKIEEIEEKEEAEEKTEPKKKKRKKNKKFKVSKEAKEEKAMEQDKKEGK